MSCQREPVAATSACFVCIRSYKLVTLSHTGTILIVCLETSSLFGGDVKNNWLQPPYSAASYSQIL